MNARGLTFCFMAISGSPPPLCPIQKSSQRIPGRFHKADLHSINLLETARRRLTLNKKSQSNLERVALPPLTAKHNYATKSPLGCPTFNPKLPVPLRRSSPLCNIPIPLQTTSISSQPFATIHPPDRQTDRQTWADDSSVPKPAYALIL